MFGTKRIVAILINLPALGVRVNKIDGIALISITEVYPEDGADYGKK